jgi:superfamily II DNA or RNA helicase
MKLREYQEGQANAVIFSEDIICICSPTGSGKTVVFCNATKRLKELSINNNILIAVNRVELLDQTKESLLRIGIIPGILNSKTKRKPISGVLIAMVETLFRRLKKWDFSEYNYIIIDECHKGEYLKLLEYFKDKKIAGFSATPMYVKKGKSLADYYKRLYINVQTSELIEQGFLARPRTFVPKNMVDKFKITAGDYDDNDQARVLSQAKYISTVVKYWSERKDKNCIVFNTIISHSIEVEKALFEAGANVVHVDGNTDESTRKKIKERLKNERGLWVCNVGVLTFGFDSEYISCIMINCKTKSIPKYNQMCGRGSRIGFDPEFEILDMHGSCIECGTWDEDKNWEYLFTRKKSSKLSVAPIKFCKNCDAVIPQSAKICKFCMYEYESEIKQKQYIDDDPTLTEYQRKVKSNIIRSIELAKSRNSHKLQPLRTMIENEISEANRDSREPDFDFIIDTYCNETNQKQYWIRNTYLPNIIAERKRKDQELLNSIR